MQQPNTSNNKSKEACVGNKEAGSSKRKLKSLEQILGIPKIVASNKKG